MAAPSPPGARRPRIVITYPFPLGGKAEGGSRTTPTLARHLGRLGADVVIVSVSTNPLDRVFPRARVPDEVLGLHLDEELGRDHVRIVRVPQDRWHHQLDGRAVRGALRRLLREGPVDAVLAHYHEASHLPALCRARRIPFTYLATWQTYSHLSFTPRSWRQRLRRIAYDRFIVAPHRAAEKLFAISEFTRGELVEHVGVPRERIELCPLGVDPAFAEVPRPEPSAIRRLIFFGRIVPSKGFDDALRALGRVAAGGQRDWEFHLFGAGRPEWALAEAEQAGIAGQVHVHAAVGDDELRRELARAQLAILPSHFESFGLSIAEAQAAGLPVVAYARGSVPEVVADGETGWLAPFRDEERLAELIAAALRDPAATHRVGLRARERAVELFSWERAARIVLDGLGLQPSPSSSAPA